MYSMSKNIFLMCVFLLSFSDDLQFKNNDTTYMHI